MHGLVAEYAAGPILVGAVRSLRERGYKRLDAYASRPVAGLGAALAGPIALTAVAVLSIGVLAAAGAYVLQWIADGCLYDPDGCAAIPPSAYMTVAAEVGALTAALTAFGAVLVRARLLALWEPAFAAEQLVAGDDGYWLAISADDPRFDRARTAGELRASGALCVSEVRP
jgi:hypothetical protein